MSSFLPLILAATAAANQPDVFFITIDTIRADRLGFYGYEYNTTPNLDALAAKALVFDNAVCEVPLTGPSFGSMMSSQFPRLTGTTRNGLRMPDTVPLVAEQFRAAGYETVCVQSNWTLKSKLSGLDRGFNYYDDDFKQRRWVILKSERDADDVTRLATQLVRERDPDKPMFGWFHYSDPHAPYKKHARFNVARDYEDDDRRAEKVSIRYASEIAFTDYQIQKLLEVLPTENAFIFFVGDHGESIYEHDYLGHGRHVYQPGMHIPWFLHGPGIEPGRSNRPVRGIDVGPTLLSLAGLEVPDSMMGRDVRAMWTQELRPRVVETYGGAVPGIPGIRAIMADDPPISQAVYWGQWKLILGESVPMLFNLKTDPLELENRAAENEPIVQELTALIAEWNAAHAQNPEQDEAELTQDDIEALETLGYIE